MSVYNYTNSKMQFFSSFYLEFSRLWRGIKADIVQKGIKLIA